VNDAVITTTTIITTAVRTFMTPPRDFGDSRRSHLWTALRVFESRIAEEIQTLRK
jgi:hypothetical protein